MRKNFGRRIAACFFAGLLLLGSVLPALAFENERQFPDVQGSEWYALPVNYLARRQVLGGKEDGKFHPEDPVTRAEFLKLLALVSGKKINSQRLQGKFSDVDNNAWYAEYVYWSVKEKIANGVGDNRFAPNSPISRQEIAVLLWRYNKNAMGRVLPKNRTMNFRDASSCAGWAAKEVAKVSGAGLLSGYEDRTFRPWGKATRAEAAHRRFAVYHARRRTDWTVSGVKFPAGYGGVLWLGKPYDRGGFFLDRRPAAGLCPRLGWGVPSLFHAQPIYAD